MKTQNKLFIILLVLTFVISACNKKQDFSESDAKEWPVYLGDKHNSHYSQLDQINSSNIKNLKVAWEYNTGDADTLGGSQIQCNPIIVNGILYGTSPKLKVFALEAATGKEIWLFDPSVDTDFSMNVNRGLSYWEEEDNQRILFTAGAYLFAVDARTGVPV